MRALRLAFVTFLVCCGSALADEAKAPNLTMGPDEGIIIIGIPAGSAITLATGTVASGRFEVDGWSGDKFPLVATPGKEHDSVFIVMKMKASAPGKGYGMSQFQYGATIDAFCGQKIPALIVKAGSVQYFGVFSLVQQRRIVDDKERPMMSISQAYDLKAAQAYMKTTFPEVPGDVVEGVLQGVRFGKDCS